MRDFIVNGARVLTSDALADAVLEYARELCERGQTAVVRFPATVDGQVGDTWLTIGLGTTLLAVSSDSTLGGAVEGEDFAAWNIRRRLAVLTGRDSELEWPR